jgi:hypothetical protein
MRDKNLGRDGIEEKYDFRGKVINLIKTVGTGYGFVYTVIGIGSEDILTLGVAAGIGTFSFLSGNYIYNLNEKLKEKALKNLEKRIAA